MESPNSTLSGIEKKEGHLPDSLPDEFSFSGIFQDDASFVSTYNYIFEDASGNQLSIYIKDYGDYQPDYNNEIEINKNTTTKQTIDGVNYYYTSNQNINSISWGYKNCIYDICGKYSFDKLEDILSLYREEQSDQ
jgi:hypothetical protein